RRAATCRLARRLRLLGRLEGAQPLRLGGVARPLEHVGGAARPARKLEAAGGDLPLAQILEERGSVLRLAVLVVDPQRVGGVAGAGQPRRLLERTAARLLDLAQLLAGEGLRLLHLPRLAQPAEAIDRIGGELRRLR